MVTSSAELLESLFPNDAEMADLIGLQIFKLTERPLSMPLGCYPVIDRTFGFILFADGGHSLILEKLGQLHYEEEKKETCERFRDQNVEYFLRNHGYYWTGALSRYPKLVTTKGFKFETVDKEVALQYRLSIMNPDFPFD